MRQPRKIAEFCRRLASLALLLPACALLALPEDASQPIEVEAGSSELYLDQGLIVYRGNDDKPVRITQGSMIISGTEIRIERSAEGSLRRVTASGNPARFQQQPALDQAIVYASGQNLDFDNSAQTLSLDGNAEFIQAGNTLSGHHIDYDMQARRANATSRSDEDRVRMTIPPAPPED